MKKSFVSLLKKPLYALSVVALFLTPLASQAALSANNPAVDLLTRVSFFIKELVIPLLFGIAFLFFLINLVRFYIIGGTNEESRVKARRNTVWGLAAFIFLIGMWGIISILLDGLEIDRSNTSLCPDYLEGCHDLESGAGTAGSFSGVNYPGTGGTGTGGSNGFPGGNSDGTGGNGGTGTGGNNGTGGTGGNASVSGLAELVFGTGKDSTAFSQYAGGPRALYQTPTIAFNATCQAGLNTLLLANKVETTQAAYALYKDISGVTSWMNLTDLHSANHISYDKDAFEALRQTGASNIHLIHTHQRGRTDNLDLTMDSHGPSSADLRAMCAIDDTNIRYAVVDWKGVWTYAQQSDTCPYTPQASNLLPVIETYIDIASLEASTRATELAEYTAAAVTPTQYASHFTNLDTSLLSSQTPQQIFGLTDFYTTLASTTIHYQQTVDSFCSTF